MPLCVAIKSDGTTCRHNAVQNEGEVPEHLHLCASHRRFYQRRIEHAGHHQAGRCYYYTNRRWCEHAAAEGGNLCPTHILHVDTLQQRAQRQAEVNHQVRLLRVELMAEDPPRPWRAIVDDLMTRNNISGLVRYQAALEVYILRDEGPRPQFNDYWMVAARNHHGHANLFDDPPLPQRDGALRAIARDAQNVHTTVVSQQTNAAVETLLAVEVPKEQQTEKAMMRAWLAGVPSGWNNMLRTMNDVNKWFNTKTCREHEDNLYRRVLRGLVATVDRTDTEMRPELYKRLWEECTESVGMCCEGHISRLCNVMVGFDDAFKPPVAVGDILQQKMAAIAGLDVPTEMKHTHATAVFVELNIPVEQRQAWLDAF